MKPWECPRCGAMNAAIAMQCTCKRESPALLPPQRKKLTIQCSGCGMPWQDGHADVCSGRWLRS